MGCDILFVCCAASMWDATCAIGAAACSIGAVVASMWIVASSVWIVTEDAATSMHDV